MATPEQAYIEIEKLVRKFKALKVAERRSMNEMQTRLGYILPMFTALGWDTSDMMGNLRNQKLSTPTLQKRAV